MMQKRREEEERLQKLYEKLKNESLQAAVVNIGQGWKDLLEKPSDVE